MRRRSGPEWHARSHHSQKAASCSRDSGGAKPQFFHSHFSSLRRNDTPPSQKPRVAISSQRLLQPHSRLEVVQNQCAKRSRVVCKSYLKRVMAEPGRAEAGAVLRICTRRPPTAAEMAHSVPGRQTPDRVHRTHVGAAEGAAGRGRGSGTGHSCGIAEHPAPACAPHSLHPLGPLIFCSVP